MAKIGFSDTTNATHSAAHCATLESAIWGFLVRRVAAIGLLSTGLSVAPLRAGFKLAPALESLHSKETVYVIVQVLNVQFQNSPRDGDCDGLRSLGGTFCRDLGIARA